MFSKLYYEANAMKYLEELGNSGEQTKLTTRDGTYWLQVSGWRNGNYVFSVRPYGAPKHCYQRMPTLELLPMAIEYLFPERGVRCTPEKRS